MSAARGFVLLALLTALPAAAGETSARAAALRELFRPVLAQPGLGGLPIQARVSVSDGVVDCDILAVVARPAAAAKALLGSARGWCEFALLHHNVKACVEEPAAEGGRMVIHVGTKHFQPVELSRPQRYVLRVEGGGGEPLSVRLSPVSAQPEESSGPALVEAVDLDEGRTGVRVRYRETLGAGTRLLAAGYFATLGRDKIGFSTTGVDAEGRTVYVGGLAGAIERNIVRHFFALDTVLEAKAGGAADSPEQRLSRWFALAARHALQLHEMDWEEYRDIKLRELAQSEALQRSIDAQAGE